MKLTPLRHSRPPGYPTQAFLLAHPELLDLRHAVPQRWRGNRVVMGTLAGALALSGQAGADGGTFTRGEPVPVSVPQATPKPGEPPLFPGEPAPVVVPQPTPQVVLLPEGIPQPMPKPDHPVISLGSPIPVRVPPEEPESHTDGMPIRVLTPQPTPPAAPTLRVPPLFVQGVVGLKREMGTLGAVSSPAFIAEDEARRLIEEEARKVGVELSTRGHPIADVAVPVTGGRMGVRGLDNKRFGELYEKRNELQKREKELRALRKKPSENASALAEVRGEIEKIDAELNVWLEEAREQARENERSRQRARKYWAEREKLQKRAKGLPKDAPEAAKLRAEIQKIDTELRAVEAELLDGPRKPGRRGPAYVQGLLEQLPTRKTALELDGWDDKRHIGYVFISAEDWKAWGEKGDKNIPYGPPYDGTFESALLLQSKLAQTPGDATVAVFYDPGIKYAYGWTQKPKDLREQVRDFLEWLKAQGVL